MKNNHKLLSNISISPENGVTFFYLFNSSSPVDVAEGIEEKLIEGGILMFNVFSEKGPVHVFEFLSKKAQSEGFALYTFRAHSSFAKCHITR